MVVSFMEDQRSIRPSDILIIYFSSLVIVDIPRLRSLWLVSAAAACRGLLTAIYVLNIFVVLLESTKKLGILQTVHRNVTLEQAIGFWGRSFFLWVTPFFQVGYSSVLSVEDIPVVDEDLQSKMARDKLESAWSISKHGIGLLKSISRAYLWSTLSPIAPRLALTGFKFCQPFLITSAVNYFMEKSTTQKTKEHGQALIGAFLLVFLGMAVCRLQSYVLFPV